ncbi:MAG: substrate-binding domain-containing protein [Ardenticatenaceae bacterium]|nr:substrate-binding domain-containing protein [Anaerolineales bacterium]MCB8983966.1 substrate-binding domain-containing protein [Ardenticatenaceae bacterium]
MHKKVTITDIAERARVSPSTVSRVLRGSAEVADSKREAVMQAVEDLQYRPNIFAQSLASGQSMTIGVLTQNFGSPFYDGILQGILLGLDKSDYWPMFADGRWQPTVELHALHSLLDRRVDGLIIIGGQLSEEDLQSVAADTPLIIVARSTPALPESCIYVDNFMGGYQATKYLIEMGHRDIVHITAPTINQIAIDDVYQRYLGYQQAILDAGWQVDPRLVVEGSLQQQSGVLAVEMLLARGRPFSAIFAANDQMAFGARLALFRRNIRVPQDVSLVGFDDEQFAPYMVPPLTTVRQPAVEIGQVAASTMLDLLDGKKSQPRVFQPELIVRESVTRRS